MAVEIHEEIESSVKAWTTFPGRHRTLVNSPETYVMDFAGDGRGEATRFYRTETSFRMGSHSLSVRATILLKAIRRLDSYGAREVSLGAQGNFIKTGNIVRYMTNCGESHFFQLEDLLILADIIDDTVVLTEVE